ncbi:MAG: NAD(P)-dependent glycerol-3-phosphate dehydrogenase [Oscillospiraceae bacterium]|nr:NAD(P)-dependent glycerol-3-phosphate dehydrogenase [Oscillospiraceae bacterium]MBR6618582.1 NAD(P)-dependent glycerol-3-phosphate dehydrogenase [Oscillospiraceae bacterium]
MAEITILGSGGFGLALAILCHSMGHKVTVWSKFQQEIDEIRNTGELAVKLPGVKIPKEITLTTDISAVSGKDVVLVGVPSQFTRSVAQEAAPFMQPNSVVLNTSKGLEGGTYKRMSQVLEEEFPNNPIVVLTGPSHAEELARGIPTTVAVACKDVKYAEYIQDIFTSPTFRLYVNSDVAGCEIGGAMKNIIALAAGVSDGLGFGDNTKAALMTRGIHEITALGLAMGARVETFAGLTGIGDLIVTCTSMHSRNRRAGILIGQGVSPEEAVRQVGTVEGYHCCEVAYGLAKKLGVTMPITEELYRVLFEQDNADLSMSHLMGRPNRHESERYPLTEVLAERNPK